MPACAKVVTLGPVWNSLDETGGAVMESDFTTKRVFQVAMKGELWRLKDSNGKPPGLIRIKPENVVTFIDNHNTWSQNLWPFSYDKVMLGHVYILTFMG